MTTTGIPRKPTSKRTGKWRSGLAVLVVGITFLVLWNFRPRVPSLLEVATQVVPRERFYGSEFAWLSNEEYLCFGADGRTLSRYRLSNGVSTTITGSFGNFSWGGDPNVSPNGKWLSWNMYTKRRDGGSMLVRHPMITPLAETHTGMLMPFSQGRWEPDSRYIIGETMDGKEGVGRQMMIYDVLLKRINETLPIIADDYFGLENGVFVAPDRLVTMPDDLYFDGGPAENEPLEIMEYTLNKTLHRIRRWSVTPPHDTSFQETRISPNGDRIAWLVYTEHLDPTLTALNRLLPFLKSRSQPRLELWISRLDGTEMHILGRLTLSTKNANKLCVNDLRWLPDGKSLSFTYTDALWTVPAKP